jgi:hypothetical protein
MPNEFMSLSLKRVGAALVLGAMLSIATVGKGYAQEDFYENKTIEIVVSAAAGSGYDIFARALADHMGKHIPGNPSFLVRNMPGAGGIVTANYMINQAPQDGTVIAATQNSLPVINLISPESADFDPLDLAWIGSATRELYVGYTWHTSGIERFEDSYEREVVLGGTTPGTFSVDIAILANEILGSRFRIISGFESAAMIRLAMERGEVGVYLGDSWTTLARTNPDWISENLIRVLVQQNSEPNPQLPDTVPTIVDLAENDFDRAILQFQVDRLEHGRPFYAPPGIPEDRLEILRRAFDATMADSEFAAAMAQMQVELDGPLSGEELTELVQRQQETPQEILDRTQEIISNYYAGN